MRFLLCTVLALSAAACTKVKGFRCADDGDCGDGACFGFCARLSPDCASGFVYDDTAGSQAGRCVEIADQDASPPPDALIPAAIIYVNAITGSDSFGDGSEGMPYRSITTGLETAQAGELVQVAPGLYDVANGEVFPAVVPPGVYLVGDQDSKGSGETPTRVVGDALVAGTAFRTALVASEGSQIAGLSFEVSEELEASGVLLLDVTAEVRNCSFSAGFAGVTISGGGESMVRDNSFELPDIEDMSLNPFKDQSAVYGIAVTGAPVIENNVSVGLGGGISVTGSGPAVIRNNQISGPNGNAILADSARIEGNTIISPTGSCFQLYGDVVARGNTCSIDTGTAVFVQSGDPDFGLQSDSGNNVFAGSPNNAVTFGAGPNTSRTMTAIGNTWFGSLQLDCASVFALGEDTVQWSSADGGKFCP